MSDNNYIDVKPSITVYTTFQNYSYKPKTALAELLDNSTASFIKHYDFLIKNNESFEPQINIIFEKENNRLSRIIVEDNAYGIEKENINRVLKIQTPPKDRSGRNEFGMGLKTAGFWFGNEIKLWTRCYENDNEVVSFDFNLNEMIKTNETKLEKKISNSLDEFFNKSSFSFGTVVEFLNINEKRDLNKFVDYFKIVDSIKNSYFKDIIKYGLKIRIILRHKLSCSTYKGKTFSNVVNYDLVKLYNTPEIFKLFEDGKGIENKVSENLYKYTIKNNHDGEFFKYVQPKFYFGQVNQGTDENKKYSKELNLKEYGFAFETIYLKEKLLHKKFVDFEFSFLNKKFRVNGFIGVLDNEYTGREKAGLILLRRGRVIVGSNPKERYRPKTIFGNASSFEYQRLYGELNLDNFPATQSKDKFDWDNGLEEEFIFELKKRFLTIIEDDFVCQEEDKWSKNIKDDLIAQIEEDRFSNNEKYSYLTSLKINLIEASKSIRFRNSQKNIDFTNQKSLEKICEKSGILGVKQSVKVIKNNESENSLWFTFTNNDTGISYGYNVLVVNLDGKETNKSNWMEIYSNTDQITAEFNAKSDIKVNKSWKVELDLSSPLFSPINDNKEFLQINIALWVRLAYAETIHQEHCSTASEIRDIISQELKGSK